MLWNGRLSSSSSGKGSIWLLLEQSWSNCSCSNFQATTAVIWLLSPRQKKEEGDRKAYRKVKRDFKNYELSIFFVFLWYCFFFLNFRLYYKKDVKPFFFLVLPPFLQCKVGKKCHLNHKDSRWITIQEPWEKSPNMNCLLTRVLMTVWSGVQW